MMILMVDLRQQSIPSFDILLAFRVPMTCSISSSVIRRFLKHLPPLEMTLLCPTVASALMLPVSLMVSNHRVPDFNQLGTLLLAVTILGVVGTGIATFLFNRLVQQQRPLFAAMTTNLVPVGAARWGHADGERISNRQIVALIGVVAMVTYIQLGSAMPIHLPSDPGSSPPSGDTQTG